MSKPAYTLSRGAVLLLLLTCGLPLLASTIAGKVVADGEPVVNAKLCWVGGNADLICAYTDAQGKFALMDSPRLKTVRIAVKGYVMQTFEREQVPETIELLRSPLVIIKLSDQVSGEPIGMGQAFVIYADTKREMGPFPVNPSGVLIRDVLWPGQVRVVGRANGYAEASKELKLSGGDEPTIELALKPESAETED